MRGLGVWAGIACAIMAAGQALAGELVIREATSPKGTAYWISPDPEAKEVAVLFAWRDGLVDTNGYRKGIATFSASTMAQAAGPYDNVELKTKLQDLGASVALSPGNDVIAGLLGAPKDKIGEAAEVFHAVLTAPRFDATDIERVRKTINQQRQRFFATPQGKLAYALPKVTTPDDPWVKVSLTLGEEVPALTPTDMAAWAKARLGRSNLKIAIAGAIDEAAAGAMIDATLDGLPEKVTLPKSPNVVLKGAGEVVHVPADSDQTILVVSGPWQTYQPGAFTAREGAADVAEDYIGEGTSGLLTTSLREAKGLTYGVRVQAGTTPREARLVISTSVPKDKAAEVLETLRATLAEAAKTGVPDDAIKTIKERIRARHGKSLTSPRAIIGLMSSLQEGGRPVDAFARYPDAVDAADKAAIDAVAREFFDPAKMNVLVVGPAEGIKTTRVFEVK